MEGTRLTAQHVRRLLAQTMPALSGAPLQYLSSGNDCDVWAVGASAG